jgi:competence protein ComFA
LQAICWYLKQGKKVCFSISRRQVVLEIAMRLQDIFPTLTITPVTQGYTTVTDGDIIVCTMHQLYRYPFCFDLLIMDEIDAFPFVENDMLASIARQSCIGQRLALSATPDEESLEAIERKEMELVTLFERPHKHPLCVPVVKKAPLLVLVYMAFVLCSSFVQQEKQVLFFVPTIAQSKIWFTLFQPFFKVMAIHSKSENKDQLMDAFRNKEAMICISTTLLERGITLPNVQVIVWQADHSVFSVASLVQIFGRVGRSFSNPEGEGVCLCRQKNDSISQCISLITKMNKYAQSA